MFHKKITNVIETNNIDNFQKKNNIKKIFLHLHLFNSPLWFLVHLG